MALQVLLNIKIVRLFFPLDICLALNIFFGGRGWVKMKTNISVDGQCFHTNGNEKELLKYIQYLVGFFTFMIKT